MYMEESKYKVVITDQANEDIENILNYIDRNFYNPDINEKLVSMLETQVKTLSLFHEINRVRLVRKERDIRVAMLMNYLICYYIDYEKNTVNIIRVFHELEDYEYKLVVH